SVSGGPLPTGFTANVMVHLSPFARTIGPVAGRQASAVTLGASARVSEESSPPSAVITRLTLTTWIGTGLIFSTVRTKTPAAPPSNRSGVAPGVTVKVIAAGARRGSANAKKGAKITAPATRAAARTDDVTSFPRPNIFVSYFQKDNKSNPTRRILREIVPQIYY